MPQFDEEDGGLEIVESAVVAMQIMEIAAFDAVNTQHPQLMSEGFVARDDHAAVASRAKIFGGIKAETTHGAE